MANDIFQVGMHLRTDHRGYFPYMAQMFTNRDIIKWCQSQFGPPARTRFFSLDQQIPRWHLEYMDIGPTYQWLSFHYPGDYLLFRITWASEDSGDSGWR